MTEVTLDDIIAAGGPIEPHLAALASEMNLPDIAIAQCVLRVGEVAPALRAVIAKASDGDPLSGDEKRLLLRGIAILAERRDTETFPVFLRLLRRPKAELVELLDDVVEFRLAPLLSGMFDGDAEALLGLAGDAANAEDVRLQAIESAAFLTFDGRIPRERMRAFLADLVNEPHANDDVALFVWADAIARLGLRDLAPLVHAAFAEGRIAEELFDKQQFDEDLAAAEAAPGDAGRFQQSSYIRDILEALDWSRTGELWDLDALSEVDADAPIEVHLELLGTEMRLPEISLQACVARFDEAASRLHTLLDRAAAGRPLSDDESLRFFRGLFVLAAARDTESCPSLLRLLRRPTEETEELLGDAITVSLPRLLISLFDGDAEALLAVVADRTLDGFLRGSTLGAATYLAWEGRIDRERLSRLLLAFYEKRLAEDEEYVWYAWMQAVATLDLRDLVPRVEAAWKAGRIDRSIQEWSDFRNDLARARTEWDDVRRFDFAEVGYVDDVVAELEWTRHWGEEENDGPMGTERQPPRDPFPEPVVNPLRNVGRNDPCPCGSGKKYKKCCLADG